jgi:glucose-1-phosphate thymidylyltransferase
VAEVKGNAIVNIIEKPTNPKSNLCVTGLYIYDNSVFNKIKTLKPSGRGELEITDVNNAYVSEGSMLYQQVKGDWTDAGTFDTLLRANIIAAKKFANNSNASH